MSLGRDGWSGWSFGMIDHEDELFIAEPTTENEEKRAALNVLDSLHLYNSIQGDRALLVHLVLIFKSLGFGEPGKIEALHCPVGHRLTKDILVEADSSLICLMCEDQIKKWSVFP